MAEELKASTLRPAEDTELLDLVAQAIETTHATLKGAKIYFFWALGKPLKFWGRIEVASEKLWWVSGALEQEGCDILLQINEDLWNDLKAAGRAFLVDHFLNQVRRKSGGQTDMDTDQGVRPLYEREEGTLKLDPRVLARHPKGLREIEEVRKLWIALAKPSQYEIEFPSDKEDEQSEPREKKLAKEVLPPAYYHERHMLSEHGPTAVRYTEADRRPESAVGIHFFPDAEAAQEAGELALLDYDMTPAAVRPVRDELVREHEEWVAQAAAQPAGSLDDRHPEEVLTH